MTQFLFLDLDDTILDFRGGEQTAIRRTLRDFGLEPSEAVLERYHHINDWHWKQLELGKLTREQVLVGRFRQLFEEMGISEDSEACSRAYMENLSGCHDLLPGAKDALEGLKRKYRLFLATNGTASVQRRRIDAAGLEQYFEQVFISQEIGENKPSLGYFQGCFSKIPGFDPEKAMIVGDSLSSDIQGGINAGIKTCWVNPGHVKAPEDLKPDYEIENLGQLEALLEG